MHAPSHIESLLPAPVLARLQAELGRETPAAGLILGSGWGAVVDTFTPTLSLGYDEIPGLGNTGVSGHAGRLLLIRHRDRALMIFQGRRHWYEGEGWAPVALPLRLLRALNTPVVILTNAAGGIRADLNPGDLMIIDDHINAMGVNPLVGPHDPTWGPRFPDMSAVYDPALRRIMDQSAVRLGQQVHHGVYLATSGPTYETPAEIRTYRQWGADAVGMSTVPEALLANAAGMRVGGISCITNLAAGVSSTPLSHAEVIAETRRAQSRMTALLQDLINTLVSDPVAAPTP